MRYHLFSRTFDTSTYFLSWCRWQYQARPVLKSTIKTYSYNQLDFGNVSVLGVSIFGYLIGHILKIITGKRHWENRWYTQQHQQNLTDRKVDRVMTWLGGKCQLRFTHCHYSQRLIYLLAARCLFNILMKLQNVGSYATYETSILGIMKVIWIKRFSDYMQQHATQKKHERR